MLAHCAPAADQWRLHAVLRHRFHPPEVDHTVHHKAGFSPEEFCNYFSGKQS